MTWSRRCGLAGLTLARHLLTTPRRLRILLLERRAAVPSAQQKVGEATVQVSGYDERRRNCMTPLAEELCG